MAHIGVITSGLSGMLHSSFEVVSRLKSEGHQVTYMSPFDVRSKVEDNGLTYVQLPAINFGYWPMDDKLILSWPRRLMHHIKNLNSGNALGKQNLKFEKFEEILSSISPDQLIIDVELHELIYSAMVLKIPFVLLNQWFPNIRVANVPPIITDIVPGKGFRGSKTGISLAWTLTKFKARLRLIVLHMAIKSYRPSVLKRYARELGVSRDSLKHSSFPPLFHYKEMTTLHMTLKEMDFQQIDVAKVVYIGPMVLDNRDKPDIPDKPDQSVNRELLNIFDSKHKGGSKIIYCSVSTLDSGDSSFIKKVIDAVKGQSNWLLIVSLGGKLNKAVFEEIPDNVFIMDWVPQLEVLKNADCSINHAGINTINECIHFQVPMLVYSGKRHDQDGCAARVVYHRMGLIGNKDVDTSDDIKTKVTTILTDPIYLNRMKGMSEKYEIGKRSSLSKQLSL